MHARFGPQKGIQRFSPRAGGKAGIRIQQKPPHIVSGHTPQYTYSRFLHLCLRSRSGHHITQRRNHLAGATHFHQRQHVCATWSRLRPGSSQHYSSGWLCVKRSSTAQQGQQSPANIRVNFLIKYLQEPLAVDTRRTAARPASGTPAQSIGKPLKHFGAAVVSWCERKPDGLPDIRFRPCNARKRRHAPYVRAPFDPVAERPHSTDNRLEIRDLRLR